MGSISSSARVVGLGPNFGGTIAFFKNCVLRIHSDSSSFRAFSPNSHAVVSNHRSPTVFCFPCEFTIKTLLELPFFHTLMTGCQAHMFPFTKPSFLLLSLYFLSPLALLSLSLFLLLSLSLVRLRVGSCIERERDWNEEHKSNIYNGRGGTGSGYGTDGRNGRGGATERFRVYLRVWVYLYSIRSMAFVTIPPQTDGERERERRGGGDKVESERRAPGP